jgi:hypothetical protein
LVCHPQYFSDLPQPQPLLLSNILVNHTAVLDYAGCLKQYACAKDLCENKAETSSFPGFSEVIQLVAYETGFAALDREGRVFTWGDERYPMCLGREVTDER